MIFLYLFVKLVLSNDNIVTYASFFTVTELNIWIFFRKGKPENPHQIKVTDEETFELIQTFKGEPVLRDINFFVPKVV